MNRQTNNPRRARLAILVLAIYAACLAGCDWAHSESPQPTIVVRAHYEGANARVVSDTITAPIEQQINGVEKMQNIRSRSGVDGSCTISIAFAPGTDLNAAQTLVQNRVALALPILPEVVKREGVEVRKGPTGVGLILFLSSPDARFDKIYLSTYATVNVKPELARAPGVAEVTLAGASEYLLRIWLDPERLAALDLAVTDVVRALERQGSKPFGATAESESGKPPATQKPVGGLGRLATIEDLNDLVIQSDSGRDIQLRDVARVELGARGNAWARLDGTPGVAMVFHLMPFARARDVNEILQQRIKQLAANLPDGINLEIAFDFTANLESPDRATDPQCILLDMDALPEASVERKIASLDRADQVMRAGKQVARVLSLVDNVFDRQSDRPCILVGMRSAGQAPAEIDSTIDEIRRQLKKQVAETAFRVRDLSQPNAFPRCGYPIDFAVHGSDDIQVREFARQLAQRMRATNKLTDVCCSAETADRTTEQFDVDASAAKAHGVAPSDVMNTLHAVLGDFELSGSGQIRSIKVQIGSSSPDRADDIKQLKVRSTDGNMVPLSALVTLRKITHSASEERLNFNPMAEITANPAAGTSLAEARALCESLAQETRAALRLTPDYRLTWLDGASGAK